MPIAAMPAPKSSAVAAQHSAHPLDNVIWSALTSRQSAIAEGDGRARRYPAAVAPFAALADTSAASFESLARLVTREVRAALFTTHEIAPPASFEVLLKKNIDQMVGPSTRGQLDQPEIVRLDAADVDEMMALVELAKPGPFGPRTHELGRYFGIRQDGRLAALAGERMQLDGYTEISAVCAAPDYRGRGYPQALMMHLMNIILARGDTPFLHVYSDNLPAIALYRKLGFTLRRTLHLTSLRAA